MKTARTLLLLLLCTRLAHGEEPTLRFSANVGDETLAEETILLVHCLADRSAASWEYSPDAGGALWLQAREEAGEVRGTFHRNGQDFPFRFPPGGSDEECEKLAPTAKASAASATAPPVALTPPSDTPPLGALASADASELEKSPSHAWLWAAGAAAVLGGILLWRAKQPAYSSVEMR